MHYMLLYIICVLVRESGTQVNTFSASNVRVRVRGEFAAKSTLSTRTNQLTLDLGLEELILSILDPPDEVIYDICRP